MWTLPFRKRKPQAPSTKTSGACGLSRKGTAAVPPPAAWSVMVNNPPFEIWRSEDGGKTWRRQSVVDQLDARTDRVIMGFFDQMGGGASGAPAASGGPLAALASGDPRLLQQLLTAGRMAGGPQAMMPQLAPSGNPALAQMQQLMAARGVAGDASHAFTFLHHPLSMDHGPCRQMLPLVGACVPGGSA